LDEKQLKVSSLEASTGVFHAGVFTSISLSNSENCMTYLWTLMVSCTSSHRKDIPKGVDKGFEGGGLVI
jgi:hypothetical protein